MACPRRRRTSSCCATSSTGRRFFERLAILKVRDDDYDAKMREIKITDAGIRLLDTFDDASNLMSGGGTAGTERQTPREE